MLPFVTRSAAERAADAEAKLGGKSKSPAADLTTAEAKARDDAEDKATARKFGECAIRIVYYFSMFFVAIYLSDLEGYWPESSLAWDKVLAGYVQACVARMWKREREREETSELCDLYRRIDEHQIY